jgi:hypothetical protein
MPSVQLMVHTSTAALLLSDSQRGTEKEVSRKIVWHVAALICAFKWMGWFGG